MKNQIDYFFDIVSPYSYIASMLIDDVARRGNAKVSWKPFLLGGVFKAVGTTDPPGLHPVKKTYLLKDLQRLSEHLKIPIKMPPDFPVRTVLAMRTLCGINADRRCCSPRKCEGKLETISAGRSFQSSRHH